MLDVIREEASKADGVAHLGFKHDFFRDNSLYGNAIETDCKVISAVVEVFKGTNKPLIMSGSAGTLGSVEGEVDESCPVPAFRPSRATCEEVALEGGKAGVRTAVMRLPLHVFDSNGSMFQQIQERKAKQEGAASYIGEGNYQQSSVHVEDAAAAYVLALQHTGCGDTFHIGHGKASGRELVAAIAAKLDISTASVSMEKAAELYGPLLAKRLSTTMVVNSSKARRQLHWEPKHPADAFLKCVAGTYS
ncbi:hypothetical protein WJX73_008927 [Symbiochloris irregularis]